METHCNRFRRNRLGTEQVLKSIKILIYII